MNNKQFHDVYLGLMVSSGKYLLKEMYGTDAWTAERVNGCDVLVTGDTPIEPKTTLLRVRRHHQYSEFSGQFTLKANELHWVVFGDEQELHRPDYYLYAYAGADDAAPGLFAWAFIDLQAFRVEWARRAARGNAPGKLGRRADPHNWYWVYEFADFPGVVLRQHQVWAGAQEVLDV